MSAPRSQRARAALHVALAGSLIVSGLNGCAAGGNIFSSAADPNDACGHEHAAFADSKSYYLQEVAQGALLGAGLGAIIGGLTGGGRGAAIGAGVGAVGGGAIGFANAQQQQNADQLRLANSAYADVSQAAQQIDRVSTTFGLLRNCRFAVADRVRAGYQQGLVPREQAALQLADQRRRFDDELVLARQYGAKMAQQDQDFRKASDELVRQDPYAQQVMATRSAARGDYVATASVSVRESPSGSAERIGSLHKGQAVRVADDSSAEGWRRVALEDGTEGFVVAKYLAPAGSRAVSGSTSAKLPPETASPTVQVAVAATETIPEKRLAYNSAVDAAEHQSSLSFDLDQARPAG